MVFHISIDGNILLNDSEEARDQEDYWDNKKRMNQQLLDKMNQAVKEEFGKDPKIFTKSLTKISSDLITIIQSQKSE